MTTASIPLAEITSTAIGVLCREIGIVNTARFLNQFTTGGGIYTEEREHLLGNPTVDELVAEIERKRTKPKRSWKPTGKATRPTKRSS
ncbi:MAG: hypothetical protein WD872_08795 [Pirellulaceae bacterium]